MKFVISIILISFMLFTSISDSVILPAEKHPSLSEVSQPTSATETTQAVPEVKGTSGAAGGSNVYVNYKSTEQAPIIINKKFINYNKDSCFINDPVCIFVQVSCVNKERLDNVMITEYTDPDLKIINYTYYLRTSTIDDIIKFEKRYIPLFYQDDIVNPFDLYRKITKSNDPVSLYIKKNYVSIFSNGMNPANSYNNNNKLLKVNLIDAFDSILEDYNFTNPERLLNLSQKTKNLITLLRADTPGNNYSLSLCNRLLLEETYPREIRREVSNLINNPLKNNLIKITDFDAENDIINIQLLIWIPKKTFYINSMSNH